jgi:hypothetical protein
MTYSLLEPEADRGIIDIKASPPFIIVYLSLLWRVVTEKRIVACRQNIRQYVSEVNGPFPAISFSNFLVSLLFIFL